MQRPRTPGARTAGGHRRPGRRAGRPGRRPTWPAADPASGRRRADPVRGAHAGAGRPGPHPRRRLPVAHATALGAAACARLALDPGADVRGGGRHVDARSTPTSPSGPPTAPPSSWRDGRAPRNRLWHRRRRRPHERHPDRRRLRRRRGRRPASSGCAIARALAGTKLSVDPARSPRRRRRRHQQGQHRDAAHRIRRHARARWNRDWSRAATTCSATTPSRPASRSSAPAPCWWRGPTRNSTRCPALKDKAERNGYHALRDRRRRRGLSARPRPRARARWAG